MSVLLPAVPPEEWPSRVPLLVAGHTMSASPLVPFSVLSVSNSTIPAVLTKPGKRGTLPGARVSHCMAYGDLSTLSLGHDLLVPFSFAVPAGDTYHENMP